MSPLSLALLPFSARAQATRRRSSLPLPACRRQRSGSFYYDLGTCAFVQALQLFGPAGVGKSHPAQPIGHEAVRRGKDVLFVRINTMLSHLLLLLTTASPVYYISHALTGWLKRMKDVQKCMLMCGAEAWLFQPFS